VTPGFYQMMEDRFSRGHDFTPDNALRGGDRVVILSHSMWRRLGANTAVIGTTILIDGEPYTVSGVLAPGPRDHGAPVAVPLVLKPGTPKSG
jgi:putative ABC transport system permease protein